MKKIKPRKNVSAKIKNGTLLMTRDEYFLDNNGYVKPKYSNNSKLYRDVIVVDSNRKGELATIKLESGGKLTATNKSKQIEHYSPFIKTKDNENKPIKINSKFVRGKQKYGVDLKTANQMKKEAVAGKNKWNNSRNIKILQKLKGRK